MPGKRSAENGDSVTPRVMYRQDITAVDGAGPLEDVSILDTRESPYAVMGSSSDVAMYGRNAQLNLAVITEVAVTLQVWLKAEVEQTQPYDPDASSSSSSSASLPSATEDWVKVDESSFTGSELWVVKDIPPGQYKVIVSAHAGGSPVHILEQHAA
jgi:hypothetical protein